MYPNSYARSRSCRIVGSILSSRMTVMAVATLEMQFLDSDANFFDSVFNEII